LRKLVAEHARRPAGELVELIIEASATYARDGSVFDDETLVVVKRQTAGRGG
jgi:serine phosphatase RsbU (regulator of sigma subunit)